jgi:hypothetical protein
VTGYGLHDRLWIPTTGRHSTLAVSREIPKPFTSCPVSRPAVELSHTPVYYLQTSSGTHPASSPLSSHQLWNSPVPLSSVFRQALRLTQPPTSNPRSDLELTQPPSLYVQIRYGTHPTSYPLSSDQLWDSPVLLFTVFILALVLTQPPILSPYQLWNSPVPLSSVFRPTQGLTQSPILSSDQLWDSPVPLSSVVRPAVGLTQPLTP